MLRTSKWSMYFIFMSGLSYLCAGENPTYEFLRNDASARAAAMGGSFVSMTNDPSALFYNPATLASLQRAQAAFGFTKHLLDINSGNAVFAQKYEDVGYIGVAANYFNYGSFPRTDELANQLGTFSAMDMSFSLSIARELDDNMFYGVTGKYIYSSIDDARSSAVAADIGILYLIPGKSPITFGASVLNLGTQLTTYINTKEPLPLDVKIGGAVKPQGLPLVLNINFHKLNEQQETFTDRFRAFSVGGEFTLSKVLRFRFGYQNEKRKELKLGSSAGLAGFSFGGGIVLETMRFDYAYNSFDKIGNINRITVGIDL